MKWITCRFEMNLPARNWSINVELALSREAVWRVLADTDRLNRLIGLSVADFASMDSLTDAGRNAQSRVAGVPIRWREAPFQWEKERSYTVRREYSTGPMSTFEGGIQLEDTDNGTRARLFATVAPSNWAGRAIISKVVPGSLDKTAKILRDFASRGHVALNVGRPSVNQAALKAAMRDMESSGARPMRVSQLSDYLTQQSDSSVAAIRPHQLAKLWNAPVLEVTRLCLYAARAGLLNLQWAVLCPNCRVSKVDYSSLKSLTSTIHCDVCAIDYETQFDKYVELRFSVHPAVRKADFQTYCLGGPAITPHVWTQVVLREGESASFRMPAVEGRLRLRVLRTNHSLPLREQEGNENIFAELTSDGWNKEWAPRPAPGRKLVVMNKSGTEAVFALEEQDWNSEAITASQVTALQEFRDLFASEVLAPGHEVGIEQLTFFFSDLLNSTEMYESDGDAAAYGRVRRHFDVLRHHIAVNNGAVVKTIGDSVMAVFYSTPDAVRASLAIQRGAANAFGPSVGFKLRIGLHHGGAIAVNTDSILDYFGRSVNIAARVETASRGDDVVMTDGVWSRSDVRVVLAEEAASVEPFQARLKGIAQTIPLYRVVAATEDEMLSEAEDERRRIERRRTERRSVEI